MTRRIASLPGIRSTPQWVRNSLDSFNFAFMIALVGVMAAMILGYYNLQRTIRDENARAQAAYVSCLASRPALKQVSSLLDGIKVWLGPKGIQIVNARALVKSTSRTDPEYATRAANLARARLGARLVGANIQVSVPTVAECAQRARRQPTLSRANATRRP